MNVQSTSAVTTRVAPSSQSAPAKKAVPQIPKGFVKTLNTKLSSIENKSTSNLSKTADAIEEIKIRMLGASKQVKQSSPVSALLPVYKCLKELIVEIEHQKFNCEQAQVLAFSEKREERLSLLTEELSEWTPTKQKLDPLFPEQNDTVDISCGECVIC